MQMNKKLFCVGSIVAFITFIASLILAVKNKTNDSGINYCMNVLLAIFGSSAVLVITSIWGYFNDRKNYEIQYASFFRDFLLRIMRFLTIYNNKAISPKEVLSIVGEIHAFYDSFAYVQDFLIDGYFIKRGCSRSTMIMMQKKAFNYSQELSRIRKLAENSYLIGEEKFSFVTGITVKQLEDEKMLIDAVLKKYIRK